YISKNSLLSSNHLIGVTLRIPRIFYLYYILPLSNHTLTNVYAHERALFSPSSKRSTKNSLTLKSLLFIIQSDRPNPTRASRCRPKLRTTSILKKPPNHKFQSRTSKFSAPNSTFI